MILAWLPRQHGRAATRPALVALAGLSMVTGVVLILSVAPSAWAADAHRNLLAARRFSTVPSEPWKATSTRPSQPC